MKKIIMLFIVALFCAVTCTHSSAGTTSEKLYDVIFSIRIDENGKLTGFKVNQVIDPTSETKDTFDLEVSSEFVNKARQYIIKKGYESELEKDLPREFYRNFLYDPNRPEKIDIEPSAE